MVTPAEAKRNQLLATIESVAVPKGYHPASILIHSEHESGRFEKIIGWNNFWGIKVPKKREWKGIVVPVITHEVFTNNFHFVKFLNKKLPDIIEVRYNERVEMVPNIDKPEEKRARKVRTWTVKLTDSFCDWPREKAALEWYMDLIERLYPNAYDNRNNPPEFFKGLVNGTRKWATDPNYADKLIALYESVKDKEEPGANA